MDTVNNIEEIPVNLDRGKNRLACNVSISGNKSKLFSVLLTMAAIKYNESETKRTANNQYNNFSCFLSLYRIFIPIALKINPTIANGMMKTPIRNGKLDLVR